MVVIERRPLLEAQVAAIAIVPIVLHDGDLVVAQALDDAADDGGLAGAGSAGDSDDDGVRGMKSARPRIIRHRHSAGGRAGPPVRPSPERLHHRHVVAAHEHAAPDFAIVAGHVLVVHPTLALLPHLRQALRDDVVHRLVVARGSSRATRSRPSRVRGRDWSTASTGAACARGRRCGRRMRRRPRDRRMRSSAGRPADARRRLVSSMQKASSDS